MLANDEKIYEHHNGIHELIEDLTFLEDEQPMPLNDTPPKWLQCNGRHLRKLAQAGLIWLDTNRQVVNDLNVFPVPDGDTGHNMFLTMRSAYQRVASDDEARVDHVADKLAQGALMGARGNSGVILSQIWKGLAKGFANKETFTSHDLAHALQEASDTAYKGVMRPVEGTILTVIREGADEAQDAVKKNDDLRFVLERVLERCQQALERTPEQLPILKQAGVVDSGGQGLVFILEGMLRYVTGQMGYMTPERALSSNGIQHQPAQALAAPEDGEIENPYDVQFILLGENLNVLEVREAIDAMGDSTVVVGDEKTIKVHIHVEDPGVPISYGISLGKITDVVVENMQLQMEEIIMAGGTNTTEEIPAFSVSNAQIGVVAVCAGDGLQNILRSVGVAHVVDGGQTNNPSTEELLAAIEAIPSNKVILLPNNKNIILASEAARDLSQKEVQIIPTRTVPQGISAMLSYNPDGALADVVASMKQNANDVATGEITRAVRTVTIDDVAVDEGQVIGLVNGRLCTSASTTEEVLKAMLAEMEMEEREIVTLYYGADISHEDAEATGNLIETWYPDIEVELLEGGQAHYFYILGAE